MSSKALYIFKFIERLHMKNKKKYQWLEKELKNVKKLLVKNNSMHEELIMQNAKSLRLQRLHIESVLLKDNTRHAEVSILKELNQVMKNE